jgi:DNA-binding GntR family transcriptional regulator
MSFEPVAAPSALVDQVHDRLVNAIADGTLPPGQRITQEELATRLGVSRQPVSHALQVLRRRGLLEGTGKRGLIVAPLDGRRMRSLYQVRAVLEGLAASLAATRMQAGVVSQRDIAEGHALLTHGGDVVENGVLSELIDADVEFHSYIHRLSGNESIVDTVAEQWPQFRRSMGAVLVDHEMTRRVWAQHREILDGILSGEAGAAADAARRHIELATEDAVHRLGSRAPTT